MTISQATLQNNRKVRGTYPLRAKKKEPPRDWLMAAWDFETKGLHGAVNFGSLQWELSPAGARSRIVTVKTEDEMLAAMLAANVEGMRWYAHNAGYDLFYLINAAMRLHATGELTNIEALVRGERNIFAVLFHFKDKPALACYDSMAIVANGGVGIKLEKLAEAFSTVGQKLKIDWKRETFNPKLARHRRYARRDTEILLDSMVNFNAAVHRHYGVNIRATAASTAMHAWRATLPPQAAYWRLRPEREQIARDCYYGGLVFLTNTRIHRDVVSLDVNSMYPYCMRRFGVPYGQVSTIVGRMDDGAPPGIYLCDFDVPASLQMGCVPYRDESGGCFPRGKWRGFAWNIEIERALRWGCKVDVIEGFVFEQIIYPFTDFVNLCERKRGEHKGQGVEMIFKTFQNSLYGKYGSKPTGLEMCLVPPFGGRTEWELACEGWQPFFDEDTGKIIHACMYEREAERSAPYMLPHWAGWITAQARGVLFDMIEAVRALGNGADVICGDTDSIKIERRYVDELVKHRQLSIGNAYGQWKVDAQYRRLIAVAPKCYSYQLPCGRYKGKAKGIPEGKQSGRFHRRVMRGETPTVKWLSGPNLASLVRGRKNQLITRSRRSSVLAESENWTEDRATRDVRAVLIENGVRIK